MSYPALSPVAPRVISPATGDPVLLIDQIERLLTRRISSVILLVGDSAEAALHHVAAAMTEVISNGELQLRDRDGCCNPTECPSGLPIVTITLSPTEPIDQELTLASWVRDDFIEYLLAVHPCRCRDVMSRLSEHDFEYAAGSPTVWKIILDFMAQNSDELRIDRIAADELRRRIGDIRLSNAIADMMITHGHDAINMECFEIVVSNETRLALANQDMATAFTNHRIIERLSANDLADQQKLLRQRIDTERADQLAILIDQDPNILDRLARVFGKGQSSSATSAAMLLSRCLPQWQPKGRKLRLLGGSFPNVNWEAARMKGSDLTGTCFANANLESAIFRGARVDGADFSHANLRRADFSDRKRIGQLAKLRLRQAKRETSLASGTAPTSMPAAELLPDRMTTINFFSAKMQHADLSAKTFLKADFSATEMRNAVARDTVFRHCRFDAADFSKADFSHAVFTVADFQTTTMDDANFSFATFKDVRFEDAIVKAGVFRGADFRESFMTHSTMLSCDFRDADLGQAKLAEIDWEGCDLRNADLRGVDFHFGSTRSGIVDSPYPSHGTRTGFYTDEYEEQYFMDPEMIRKANLYGSDLRGAAIHGVDFYLVDLRSAKLDPWQRTQVAASGAILDDPER